jgi:hypothetical protein
MAKKSFERKIAEGSLGMMGCGCLLFFLAIPLAFVLIAVLGSSN